MRKTLLAVLAAATTLAVAPPAYAKNGPPPPPTSDGNCNVADTNPMAGSCVGYYTGNLFDGNAPDTAEITTVLANLGITYTGNLSSYVGSGSMSDSTNLTQLFGTLTGEQVFGFHIGGKIGDGNAAGGGASAFYVIDFGSGGVLKSLPKGISNGYLFGSVPGGVPEPATWAMMLIGFGGVGLSMRRSKERLARVTQIA